jgi:hypothetical protein
MIETPSHSNIGDWRGFLLFFIGMAKPALWPLDEPGLNCPYPIKNRRSACTLVGCTWKGRFKGTLILVIGVFCFF